MKVFGVERAISLMVLKIRALREGLSFCVSPQASERGRILASVLVDA